jgi:hypothetical protein
MPLSENTFGNRYKIPQKTGVTEKNRSWGVGPQSSSRTGAFSRAYAPGTAFVKKSIFFLT